MAYVSRQASPDCMRHFLTVLRGSSEDNVGSNVGNMGKEETRSIDEIVTVLVNVGGHTSDAAREIVRLALNDGLLMPVAGNRSRLSTQEPKQVRLPNSEEVRVSSSHDWYCYECHMPGTLENCTQCWRSFHRNCFRKNPARPNYNVPSSKNQKNRLPEFSSETESDADTARGSTLMDSESEVRAGSSLLNTDQASLSTPPLTKAQPEACDSNCDNNDTSVQQVEPKPVIEDLETKSKVDVVCLGMIRPPNRKRRATSTLPSNVSYKSELSQPEEDDHDQELCTSCRLLKRANLHNPPNLQPDELCHLVNLTFSYNREWVTNEIRSHLEAKGVQSHDIKLINHLLLYSPIKRLADIESKINRQQYTLLMQFLVDLMDVQHNIGVFFGSSSTEFESTKWLLRDVAHDISEIRRCPDCFRYSHEKKSLMWFAKPCLQRHELVYAKHSSFPYWPAKVIRVLPNHKYDVRFFGGNHSRALIDVRNIKPIDTEVKSLKQGSSRTIKKAMEELRFHQALASLPPSTFSFRANPQETNEIIRSVLGSSLTTLPTKRRTRKRRKSSDANQQASVNAVVASTSASSDNLNNSQAGGSCSEVTVLVKRLKPHQIKNIGKKTEENSKTARTTRKSGQSKKHEANSNHVDIMLEDLKKARQIVSDYMRRNKKLEEEKRKLTESINKLKIEERVAKRKQWCYWCLEEAIYLCCFRAAYCSDVCQARHWKDGHSKVCKNPTNISTP